MPDWNILITDGLHEKGLAIFRKAARIDDRPGISAEELIGLIPSFDALVVRGRTQVSAQVMAAASRLKVVGRAGVGVDNIDLAAADRLGIQVVNAPISTTQAVVELTLAMLLSLARGVARADASMKAGQWLKNELQGVEIQGKILGLIGVGNIGAGVARAASALGMVVLGYDPYLTQEVIMQRLAQPVALEELLARSDFISLHLPLTPQTRNFFGDETLDRMKDGVRLICTARGGLIDENALLEALDSGKVAGAALDVFAKEPPGSVALVKHPNLIATPHIGAQTEQAQIRAAEDIAVEVLAALRGEPLRWKVV